MQWLLLGEGDMYESSMPSSTSNKVDLAYFELKDGDLIDKGKMFFEPQFLDGMLEAEHLMLVEHEGQKLFVDTSNTKVICGKYLINSDDVASIVELQRLPGNKFAINFNATYYEVKPSELDVRGKVASVIQTN